MSDSDEQKSYYLRDGVQYPRVTHVLKVLDKPGLGRWRGRLGNQEADTVSREGSRVGSEFHTVATEIAQGRHMQRGWQAPGEYRHMAAAYIDWVHKWVDTIILFEQTFYSHPQRDEAEAPVETDEPLYAGTIDLLAKIRGDRLPSLIDIKTSNSVSDDWPLQLSGYRRLLTLNGIETERRIIVRIPKTGTIEAEAFEYRNHAEDEAAWMHTLALWQWQQKAKERRKAALVVAGL